MHLAISGSRSADGSLYSSNTFWLFSYVFLSVLSLHLMTLLSFFFFLLIIDKADLMLCFYFSSFFPALLHVCYVWTYKVLLSLYSNLML